MLIQIPQQNCVLSAGNVVEAGRKGGHSSKESFGQLRQNSVLLQGGSTCTRKRWRAEGSWFVPQTHVVCKAREHSFGKKRVRTPQSPCGIWLRFSHTNTHNAEASWVLIIPSVTTTLTQYKNSLFYEVYQGYAVFLSLWNDKSLWAKNFGNINPTFSLYPVVN